MGSPLGKTQGHNTRIAKARQKVGKDKFGVEHGTEQKINMAEQRLERGRPQLMAVQPASGISNTERQRQRERKERRGKMKIWQEGESRQRQQCKNNHQQGQYQNWKGGNGDNRKGKQAKF